MAIRGTPGRPSAYSTAIAASFAFLLASCGPAAPTRKQAMEAGPLPSGSKSEDCLGQIWKAQSAPNKAFDRANDLADGGPISCSTGTSASEFAGALVAIRDAAARGDKSALGAKVGLPLLYIDGHGRKRELDRAALAASADEVFSPPVVALLKRVTLDDLSVVPREGAFIDLGAVWMVAGRTGGRPRIVTIDRQALDEAVGARGKAQVEGAGRS